jgi:hypothetical protein
MIRIIVTVIALASDHADSGKSRDGNAIEESFHGVTSSEKLAAARRRRRCVQFQSLSLQSSGRFVS